MRSVHTKKTKKVLSAFILILTFVMVITACGGNQNNNTANQPGNEAGQGNEGATNEAAGDSALAKALNGEFKGTKVTMFGPFTDADEVKFTESIKAFEEKSGI